uniref:Uncharacterized protein n=1 Tax=Kalanchoe fedtschenkoi TaxID=63787 RepID=A0A7N0UPE5_KALFE
MEEGEDVKKKMEDGRKKRVESLGWLTESTILPKKHKVIEGVGASSILELKAHLYQSQQDLLVSKDSPASSHHHRAKKKISPRDAFSSKNSGVDARAHKDKLELKAVNDGSVSYAALERKAQLYDKLARGELSDEEEAEKYCVDFFSKSVMQERPQQRDDSTENDVVEPALPFNSQFDRLGQAAGTMDREEHKRFVREVHDEARDAREKASQIKLQRQEQAASRREKLKQAFLKKKLENLKAASKSTES